MVKKIYKYVCKSAYSKKKNMYVDSNIFFYISFLLFSAERIVSVLQTCLNSIIS